jgi:pimeloyl-ACP methyl ester carboxylesterase
MDVLLPVLERLGRRVLRRQGFKSTHVNTAHGRLHVYDAPGSGTLPTTVVLHGLAATATPFGPMLSLLRKHVRRVVAFDLPGHGFSEHGTGPLTPERLIETVSAAIDATIDERDQAMLVGNSLGGALALHYAATRAARVHSIVLVSPGGARGSDEEWDALKATFDVRSKIQGRAFLDRLYHSPPWFVPLLAHLVPSSFQSRAVREILSTVGNETVPTPEVLGALRMPVLFLWGQSERILPQSHFDYFVRHLPPHAVVERPVGFGHCPHLESPRVLARRIVAFAQAQSSKDELKRA